MASNNFFNGPTPNLFSFFLRDFFTSNFLRKNVLRKIVIVTQKQQKKPPSTIQIEPNFNFVVILFGLT